MNTRLVYFLAFTLFSLSGVAQQRGFNIRLWGAIGMNGSIDKPVKKIDCGGATNAVLLQDSTIVAWGLNTEGQCLVPLELSRVVDISMGYFHGLALKSDGKVVAWGNNFWGQCNIPLGLSGVKSISGGILHSLAIQSDSTVVGWGYNGYGQISPPLGLSKVIAIDAGENHSVALKSNGTVVAWGDNSYGQCNVPSGLSGVVAISCLRFHCLALKSDGHVVAWGRNESGQCNVPTGLSSIVSVSTGFVNSVALKNDGTVVVWGDPSLQSSLPPFLTNVRSVSAGENNLMALKSDGTIVGWGGNAIYQNSTPKNITDIVNISIGRFQDNIIHLLALKADSSVVCWGANYYNQCDVPIGLSSVIAISAGAFHSLALKADGHIVAWGSNRERQIDIPTNLTDVKKIAAGRSHSLALKSNGSVIAWGNNLRGQTTIPTGLLGVSQIRAGLDHSVALKFDGTVITWGDNNLGQCNVPQWLRGVKQIAAGANHTIALTSNGGVVTWGDNGYGQCNTPSRLDGIVAVDAGVNFSLALRSDGKVFAWGENAQFQCKIPSDIGPVKLITGGRIFSIAIKGNLDGGPEESISGRVFRNINDDCIQDSLETPIPFQAIQALPGQYFGFSDSVGKYTVRVDSGAYQVRQFLRNDAALLQRQICPSNNASHATNFAGRGTTISGLNFANKEIACPRLEVQVSSNRRRRCFKNSTVIKYANSGYAAQADVVAHLKMPRYVVLKSSSVAYTFNSVDSTYSFNLGSLAAGQIGQIIITDSVLCVNGIRGLQQCTKAWLTPGIQPCQWPAGYDGSNIDVRGKCVGNVPHFKLKNLGQAMSSGRSYRVFADSLLAYQGTYNLATGDSTVLSFPVLTRSAVLRLEAELDSLSPYGHFASDFASCGPIITSAGDNYATNSGNPVEATDCQEIRDSYDPNDKQVFPKGVSAAGNIEPGTWLTYRLRFINKGNDTAYMVRIVDTLSNDLDLGSLQFGASSHRFVPKISGKGRPVLTLVFDPINLPDSARSGQAAASGFVDFRIRSSSSAPLGTQIKNHADILFDFNPAVRTNTVLNTLYRPTLTPGVIDTVIITTTRKPNRTPVPFTIQPNPGNGKLTLTTTQAGQLQIISPDGKLDAIRAITKGSNALDISHLPTGLYLLRLNGAALRFVRE